MLARQHIVIVAFVFICTCATACRSKPNPPASIASFDNSRVFFVPEQGALNLDHIPVSDAAGPQCSVLTYDIQDLNSSNVFVGQVTKHMLENGWHELAFNPFLIGRSMGWNTLPLRRSQKKNSQNDEVFEKWWFNRDEEAIEFNLFRWNSRGDGGPKYQIRFSHFGKQAASKIFAAYVQKHGYPWNDRPGSYGGK